MRIPSQDQEYDNLSKSFEQMRRDQDIDQEDFVSPGYNAHDCIIKWAQQLLANERASKDRQNECLKLVEEWQKYWMSDKQNPPDEDGYYRQKAMRVDANMRHHLAEMIADREKKLKEDKCIF